LKIQVGLLSGGPSREELERAAAFRVYAESLYGIDRARRIVNHKTCDPIYDDLGHRAAIVGYHREATEIFPFLGTSRLAEVVDRHGADLVVHGHAHHGRIDGRTPAGVAVHNVAISLLQAQERSSVYRVFDL
jgi:hypothetical protein